MTVQAPYTREELLNLPPVIDLETAGRILLIGRTQAYDLARAGKFPTKLLKLGRSYRVPVTPLLELIGVLTDENQRTTEPIRRATVQVRTAMVTPRSHTRKPA